MNHKFDVALSFATENQQLVEKVYHYLKAESINVFFAPSPEGQMFLSGKNQREAFYNIFGMDAKFVALFVSKYYISKEVPMEEAGIAFAKHVSDGSVIPIYIDDTSLPTDIFNPKSMNYFKSSNPAVIASHLAGKIKIAGGHHRADGVMEAGKNVMNINGNIGGTQVFVQEINGSIKR